MDANRKTPIGIELVRRGVVTEEQINSAIEYQKSHRNKKIGEILKEQEACDERTLIQAIGDILGEKGILIDYNDIQLSVEDYISIDIVKECKAVPFSIVQGRVKVCFADTSNKNSIEKIRLLLLNKGLIMEKYITFESNIKDIISMLDGNSTENINTNTDIVKLMLI